MQLKKYEAPTIQDAFKRIKAELGDDAVIFSTRTIPPRSHDSKRKVRNWIDADMPQ